MITLYDLVFDNDVRPSPFCWRTKLALKHKGLVWRDEPMGFTEKDKIAFAQSQTVPVIHDGTHVVKDSWAIALHLEKAYPGKPLFPDDPAKAHARFVNGWADTSLHILIFPMVVGDMPQTVRPQDRDYIIESRGKRLGTTDFATVQKNAREKGVVAFRQALEPVRRVMKEQPFLSGTAPAYADYILFGSLLWPRSFARDLELLDKEDIVWAWRERMLDLFDGFGRKAKTAVA
ncbi:glutathione S-transferase N-terminal domain-containing protein [Reyranella sp.]|uniref:glutathione S-transferase N-terminal domain-containing protein n=1 Tax=Reyranella sp. TaxID=1929291 RepID=UPI002F92BD4A